MSLLIDAATLKNTKSVEKPNEDYYLYDEKKHVAILLDGVSRDKENGIYPDPSPALDVSIILAEYCMEKAINHLNSGHSLSPEDLKEIFIEGNGQIAEYNRKHPHDFPAGTVGIFVYYNDNSMDYAYIGDCYGVHICGKKTIQFTDIQTKAVAEHKKELTTYQIRKEICNNHFHPFGYGVLDGNKNAKHFISTGHIELACEDTIFLFSDGAKPSIDYYGLQKASTMRASDVLFDTDKDTGCKVNGLDDQALIILRQKI